MPTFSSQNPIVARTLTLISKSLQNLGNIGIGEKVRSACCLHDSNVHCVYVHPMDHTYLPVYVESYFSIPCSMKESLGMRLE